MTTPVLWIDPDAGGAGEVRSGRRRKTRVFRVGRPCPLIRWRKSGITCRNVGPGLRRQALAFVIRSTHWLSGQDPLVSDLVARARSYSMRRRASRGKRKQGLLDGYRIAIHPLIWFSAFCRLNKRDNF
jgi:hypothetical protein